MEVISIYVSQLVCCEKVTCSGRMIDFMQFFLSFKNKKKDIFQKEVLWHVRNMTMLHSWFDMHKSHGQGE